MPPVRNVPPDQDGLGAERVSPERASPIHSPALGTGALVAVGTAWLLLQTVGAKIVLLLGQIVLAGLLAPEDFGQIAMAYTVTTFVALLINPGIDLILVKRGRRFHLWSTPAFYFSLSTGLLGALVILAAAPIVALFYDTPQLKGLLAVLAIATPIGCLLLVPTAKLRAEMRFKALAVINLLQVVLQTCLTVGLAAAGFGVYSFVLPMPAVYIATAAILWIIARPIVRLRNPFQYWRYLVADSGYIFGQRVLHTATGQGDYIILGGLYGDVILGPYFFAYGMAKQAIRLTAGSIQLVLTAGLTRLPAFSAQQTQAALRATNALTLVGIPLCMLQAAVAEPLLRALYGDKWLDAIPLVQFISVGMAFDVASWSAGSLLHSRGQFRFAFYWSSVFAPVFLAAILIGALFGKALGVAIAVCAFLMILSPTLVFWVFRSSNVSWSEILGIYLRPLFIGALTAGGAASAIQLSIANGWQPAIQLVLAICVGLVTMGVSAGMIMQSTCQELMARIKHVFPPLSPLRG